VLQPLPLLHVLVAFMPKCAVCVEIGLRGLLRAAQSLCCSQIFTFWQGNGAFPNLHQVAAAPGLKLLLCHETMLQCQNVQGGRGWGLHGELSCVRVSKHMQIPISLTHSA